MQMTKERFTQIALTMVQPNEQYDEVDIIHDTASELTNELIDEFGEIDSFNREGIRQAFIEIAEKCIDWKRLNRKRDPEEYADLSWQDGGWA